MKAGRVPGSGADRAEAGGPPGRKPASPGRDVDLGLSNVDGDPLTLLSPRSRPEAWRSGPAERRRGQGPAARGGGVAARGGAWRPEGVVARPEQGTGLAERASGRCQAAG